MRAWVVVANHLTDCVTLGTVALGLNDWTLSVPGYESRTPNRDAAGTFDEWRIVGIPLIPDADLAAKQGVALKALVEERVISSHVLSGMLRQTKAAAASFAAVPE